MKRFRAIFKKEFRQIRRDPLSLGLLLFLPAVLLILYGYALSFDVKHIATAVLDQDDTRASREFLDSMFQNPYFTRHRTLASPSQADLLLKRGLVRLVVIVPRGYAEAIDRGRPASVQALIDGADATAANTASGYLEALAQRHTQALRNRETQRGPLAQVQLEPRVWFNPELESARFLVPGLIAMLLMLSSVIATSLSLVREKERETIEQIRVSPVRTWELLAGKTLPYVMICLVTIVLILLLGYALFGVAVRGSYLLLGLCTVLFLVAALGMGMLISSITRSQQVAFQIATISSLLPSIILSGLIFPISSMPVPLQVLTQMVIPRHYVSALRKIILKGASWDAVWPELAALLALGIFFNLLAARTTRKES